MILLLSAFSQVSCQRNDTPDREYYHLKIYHLSQNDPQRSEDQETILDHYLEKAFIPALQRAGIGPVGVFKPLKGMDESGPMVFVLIPCSTLEQYEKIPELLLSDQQYLEEGAPYIEASHEAPPYERIESILMRAFEGTPSLQVPDHSSSREKRVYELRSYESATGKLNQRKVAMFNEGESALFQRLGFQPVFFGEVLSSGRMPHLMYMTTFSDTLSQKELWERFRNDPAWLEMKDLERYRHTVSHIDRYLLCPTGYSDY